MVWTSVVPPIYLRSQARHSGTGVPAIKIRGAPRPKGDGSQQWANVVPEITRVAPPVTQAPNESSQVSHLNGQLLT